MLRGEGTTKYLFCVVLGKRWGGGRDTPRSASVLPTVKFVTNAIYLQLQGFTRFLAFAMARVCGTVRNVLKQSPDWGRFELVLVPRQHKFGTPFCSVC